MQKLLVEVKNNPNRGEYAGGEAGLTPPSRLGQMPFTLPFETPVCLVGSRTGLPVCRSMELAQFTCTNAVALMSLPVARSSRYWKPFLSKCTRAFSGCPLTLTSARIIGPVES